MQGPTGDNQALHDSPRCGARTRHGTSCMAPAVWSAKAGDYTRCRMHGGQSTGPTTADGLERCRRANWKHGRFSEEVRDFRREVRAFLREMRQEDNLLERVITQMERAGRLPQSSLDFHVPAMS